MTKQVETDSSTQNVEIADYEASSAPITDSSTLSVNLSVNISSSLKAKIADQAADEGITLNEYVGELLAEGVVLRAWEIVERKAQMRGQQGPSHNAGNGGGHRNNNNNRRNDRFNGGGGGGRRGGMPNARYNSIMDDKASFLEYVRNQERQQR